MSPPSHVTLSTLDLHIWRSRLHATPDRIERLSSSLSTDEIRRAERFVFKRDYDRFIVARATLRYILATYLAISAADLRFGYTRYGKPYLIHPPSQDQLTFNLAHSGELAVFVVARGRHVGIDVEQVVNTFPYQTVAHSILSPKEIHALAELPEEPGRLAFFTTWVQKEAYLKARGAGLSCPLADFETSQLPSGSAVIEGPAEDGSSRDWSLHALEVGSGYTAAVVVEGQAAVRYCYDLASEWVGLDTAGAMTGRSVC
jgi:4'-phosphopantetheinyl transferase